MSHLHNDHVPSHQILIQCADAGNQKTVQVGRDYTQIQTIRFNLWISLICILIFAATASVIVSLFGEEKLPVDMPPQESFISDVHAG